MTYEYQVRNIIAGREQEGPSSAIERNGVTVTFPTTSRLDLAVALSAAGASAAALADVSDEQICESVRCVAHDYLTDDDMLHAIALFTGSPLRYVRASVENLRTWMAGIDRYMRLALPLRNEACRFVYQPTGITGVILAGDEVALAGYVAVNALLSRNPTILRPSALEAISAAEVVRALVRHGLPAFVHLVSWPSHVTELTNLLLDSCRNLVLIGSDRTVDEICVIRGPDGSVERDYRVNRNVVEFTAGHATAIVTASADLDRAAEDVIHAAAMNKGAECINAGKVYVESAVSTEFVERLVERARQLRRGDAIDSSVDIGWIGEEMVAAIRRRSGVDEPFAPGSASILHADFGSGSMGLLIVLDPSNGSDFVLSEMPGPTLAVVPYDGGIAAAVRLANDALAGTRSRVSTVTSVHGARRDEVAFAARHLATHKIIVNGSTGRSMDGMSTPHHGTYLVERLVRRVTVSE